MTFRKIPVIWMALAAFAAPHLSAKAEEAQYAPQLPATPTQPASNYSKNFVFTLGTDKDTYAEGEGVMLRVSLANVGKEDAAFDSGGGGALTYNIKVTLPNGKETPLTMYGDLSRAAANVGGSSERSLLAAGRTKTVTVPLSRYFDLSMGGTYKVSASIVMSTYTTGAQRATLTASLDLKLPE